MNSRIEPLRADVGILSSSNPSNIPLLLPIIRAVRRTGLSVLLLHRSPEFVRIYAPDYMRAYDEAGDGVVSHVLPADRGRGLYRIGSPLYMVHMMNVLPHILGPRPFDVFLSLEDWGWISRTLIQYCRKHGIPTVTMQEGASVRVRRQWSKVSGGNVLKRLLYPPLNLAMKLAIGDRSQDALFMKADYAFVYGEYMRKELIRLGRDPATIRVVGNPRWDDTPPETASARPKQPTVLFAHQKLSRKDRELAFYRLLARTCCDVLGYRLLFKLHPHASEEYEAMMEAARAGITHTDRFVIPEKQLRIEELLSESSVLVTYTSMAAFNAIARGVPVITANYARDEDTLEIPRFGAGVRVDKMSELEQALRSAVEPGPVRDRMIANCPKAVEVYFGRRDRSSSGRVARVLRDIML